MTTQITDLQALAIIGSILFGALLFALLIARLSGRKTTFNKKNK
jgi:hypothetical protein